MYVCEWTFCIFHSRLCLCPCKRASLASLLSHWAYSVLSRHPGQECWADMLTRLTLYLHLNIGSQEWPELVITVAGPRSHLGVFLGQEILNTLYKHGYLLSRGCRGQREDAVGRQEFNCTIQSEIFKNPFLSNMSSRLFQAAALILGPLIKYSLVPTAYYFFLLLHSATSQLPPPSSGMPACPRPLFTCTHHHPSQQRHDWSLDTGKATHALRMLRQGVSYK